LLSNIGFGGEFHSRSIERVLLGFGQSGFDQKIARRNQSKNSAGIALVVSVYVNSGAHSNSNFSAHSSSWSEPLRYFAFEQ